MIPLSSDLPCSSSDLEMKFAVSSIISTTRTSSMSIPWQKTFLPSTHLITSNQSNTNRQCPN